jgi:hypothetical protein
MMWFYLYIEWDDAKSTGALENMPQSVDRLLETIKAQVVGSKAGAGFWVLGAGFRIRASERGRRVLRVGR